MRWLALVPLVLILTGCGQQPTQPVEKEPEARPEPVTGRLAYHRMFIKARQWTRDAELLRLSSIHLEGFDTRDGKAPAWRGIYVSQSLGQMKMFTYSVVEGPGNLHKGVFEEPATRWAGPTPTERVILQQAIQIDSDEAYQVALKNGAEEFLKKFPDVPLSYQLEFTNEFPNPTWRILWGTSPAAAKVSFYIDATAGKFLAKRF